MLNYCIYVNNKYIYKAFFGFILKSVLNKLYGQNLLGWVKAQHHQSNNRIMKVTL